MTNIKSPTTSHAFFVALFLAAFLGRTVFHLGPNIELVTTAMILASYFLGKRQAFWLVLAIMVATDLVLGNTSIFIFTWSGFLLPALFSKYLINRSINLLSPITNHQSLITKKILKAFLLLSAGIISNIFFFLWTNFGVWLLDSWGMYTNDFSGLVRCYINGLPFLKNQLISSLIFIPAGFLLAKAALRLASKFHSLRLPKMLWS